MHIFSSLATVMAASCYWWERRKESCEYYRYKVAGHTKMINVHTQSQTLKKLYEHRYKNTEHMHSQSLLTIKSTHFLQVLVKNCLQNYETKTASSAQLHQKSCIVLWYKSDWHRGTRKDTKKNALRRSSICRCLLDSWMPFLSSSMGLCLKLTTTSAWEGKTVVWDISSSHLQLKNKLMHFKASTGKRNTPQSQTMQQQSGKIFVGWFCVWGQRRAM